MSATPTEATRCLSCGGTNSSAWAVATDVEYQSTPDEFTYRRCLDCGVLFIDPVPVHRLSEIYPPKYYSYSDHERSLTWRVKDALDRRHFASVLSRVPGGSLGVLDVGGGIGQELTVVRDADLRVDRTVVVDLDPASAEGAEARGHRFVHDRIEDFESTEQFDLVLLLNLIEHVEDPRGVLTKVRALLSDQGRVLIKTPNTKSLDARIFRRRSWGGYHCPRHWVLFDRESFTKLASDTGYRVERMSYTQGAPFWATSLLAQLHRWHLVRVDKDRPILDHPLFGVLVAAFAAFDLIRKPISRPSQMFFELSQQH